MSVGNVDTLSPVWDASAMPARNPRARPFPNLDWVEVAIAISFCIYAALFIFRSSFKIDDIRYFSLFDDDMISMRYAANLAHGDGLIWNPGGERVLGFTNPLWVLYMAAFHLLPISAAKVSLCIQISGALFLLLNLLVVRAISKELMPGSWSAAVVAMALTAFYGPLNNWSLQGTEVSILTLVVSVSVWLALLVDKSEAPAAPVYLLLGISTLIRPDMVIFSGALLLAMAAMHPNQWQRHLILGGAIVMAFLIAQVTFDFSYYGEALPNTYYLKMTGFPLLLRIRRGIVVAILFLIPWIPIAAAYSLNGVGKWPPRAWLLAAAIAAQLAYSIWVGGDAWEWYGGSNRYVSIAMPLVFILSAVGIENLAARIAKSIASAPNGLIASLTTTTLAAVFLILVNISHSRAILLLARPIQTDGNEDMVRQALLIRQLTDEHATIAVVWAGAAPYFAGRQAIDLLGKNDGKVAREPMRFDPSLLTRSFWLLAGTYEVGLRLLDWATQTRRGSTAVGEEA